MNKINALIVLTGMAYAVVLVILADMLDKWLKSSRK
jgi:capsular polysaccharide biosynthesis protein